jgi:hypothetical protein
LELDNCGRATENAYCRIYSLWVHVLRNITFCADLFFGGVFGGVQMDWVNYFNSAFGQVEYSVSYETPVVAYGLDYLKRLNGIIRSMLARPDKKM